ncbi:MAG: hypothetical protein OEL76_13750 [Siculibacillus sp.]|nr:hypothetical protein [Siculibacillus sp.]
MPYFLSAGPETRVDTTTTADQTAPTVTALADGGWVVVWTSADQDGSGTGVYLQRLDATGTPVGGEVRVTTTTAEDQAAPVIAALPDGGWVVAWHSHQPDIRSWDILQQRFGADGVPVGSETVVNTVPAFAQTEPTIASLGDGGWIVSWQSLDQDGSNWGIYQQRFAPDGRAAGGEVRVNTVTDSGQARPAVTGLADGGWVVTWAGTKNGPGWDIYQQRYDADGIAIGDEVRVNDVYVESAQDAPAVTALADGGWVVTWHSDIRDGFNRGYDILQRRYGASGDPLGPETFVNTHDVSIQAYPSVVTLADGGWVVSWLTAYAVGGDGDIALQRYAADGTPLGSETRVNQTTADDQLYPELAALADGGWVVTWQSRNQDGSGWGIWQRRFDAALTDTVTLTTGADTVAGGDGPTSVLAAPTTLTADDDLDGGAGVDTIEMTASGTLDLTRPVGLAGFERLVGAAGDDTFVFDAARLAAFASIDGGAGADTLRIDGGGTASLLGTTLAGIEEIVLTDAAGTSLHVADAATALLADAGLGAADTAIVEAELDVAARAALVAHGFETVRYVSAGNTIELAVGPDAITETIVDTANTRTWASQTLTWSTGFDLLRIDRTTDAGWHATHEFAGGRMTRAHLVDAADAHASIAEYTTTFVDGVPTSRIDLLDDGDVRETTFAVGRRATTVLRDVDDDAVWDSITLEYAADGVTRTSRTVVRDDGDITRQDHVDGVLAVTTFLDGSDTSDVASIVTRYDATGARVSELRVLDGGDTRETTFEAGVRTKLEVTDVDGDANWTVRTRHYADDGTTPVRLETLLDDGTARITALRPGEILRTTEADDILTGASGRDTFVITPGGHDVVANFEVDIDALDLTAFHFADAEALAAALRPASATAVEIAFGPDDSIILRGLPPGLFATLDVSI